MKKILSYIIKILLPRKPLPDATDESIFEHLDGAEFDVVYPKAQPLPSAD